MALIPNGGKLVRLGVDNSILYWDLRWVSTARSNGSGRVTPSKHPVDHSGLKA